MAYVVRHGRKYHGHGAVHYFFGRKEQRRVRDLNKQWLDRLNGIVVVMDPDLSVVQTTYRNHDAPRHLKKKAA